MPAAACLGLRSLDWFYNEQRNFAACAGAIIGELRIGSVGQLPPLGLLLSSDCAGPHSLLYRAVRQLDKWIRNEVVIPERILGRARMRSDHGVNAIVFDPHQRNLTDLAGLCALAG